MAAIDVVAGNTPLASAASSANTSYSALASTLTPATNTNNAINKAVTASFPGVTTLAQAQAFINNPANAAAVAAAGINAGDKTAIDNAVANTSQFPPGVALSGPSSAQTTATTSFNNATLASGLISDTSNASALGATATANPGSKANIDNVNASVVAAAAKDAALAAALGTTPNPTLAAKAAIIAAAADPTNTTKAAAAATALATFAAANPSYANDPTVKSALNIAAAANALTASALNPSNTALAATAASAVATAGNTTATTNVTNSLNTLAAASMQLSTLATGKANTNAQASTSASGALNSNGYNSNNYTATGGVLESAGILNSMQASLNTAKDSLTAATPGIALPTVGPTEIKYPTADILRDIESYQTPQSLRVVGPVNVEDQIKNAFTDFSILLNNTTNGISEGFTAVSAGSISDSPVISIFYMDDGKKITNIQAGY
jgi:hypothetical protein